MISLVPDLRRPILRPPQRDPIPLIPRPEPKTDYLPSFDIVGTAHFTGRSIADAIRAASSRMHSAVAIELDRQRFEELNRMGYVVGAPDRARAEGEFVAATDAFGNREGDIWLIDSSLDEIDRRVRMTLTKEELWRWATVSRHLYRYEATGALLWEAGMKDRALSYLDVATEAMREYFPTLHRVLIEERNLLMSARLIEVVRRISTSEGTILVLMGMAHVDGVREYLKSPERISEGLEMYGLNYSSPTRVRRAKVS